MAGSIRTFLGLDSYGKLPDGSEMSYEEQYRKVVNTIGLDVCIKYLPKGGVERFKEALATEVHLNSIPMKEWDACYSIVKSTRKERFAMEQDIKRRIELHYAEEMKEKGFTLTANIFIQVEREKEDSKDFTKEMIKIGINELSPSCLVSTLKRAAMMWVERDGEVLK